MAFAIHGSYVMAQKVTRVGKVVSLRMGKKLVR